MIDRVANILSGSSTNKPWDLYHLLYFEYRYRFEYQYRVKNPLINLRVPEYLLVGNAYNTTQIFLFNLKKKRSAMIKKLGRDQFRFYTMKLQQQLLDLDKMYHRHPHTILGINPQNGLVHPIDYLETQQMAKNFSLIINQFPFTLRQFKALNRLFPNEAVFSILQGLQISDRQGGTTFLIKVKEFMVMYYEVPNTRTLDKHKVHVNNKNVKVNVSSQGPNLNLQTHLFHHLDQVSFLYEELRMVGNHLQKMALAKVHRR